MSVVKAPYWTHLRITAFACSYARVGGPFSCAARACAAVISLAIAPRRIDHCENLEKRSDSMFVYFTCVAYAFTSERTSGSLVSISAALFPS